MLDQRHRGNSSHMTSNDQCLTIEQRDIVLLPGMHGDDPTCAGAHRHRADVRNDMEAREGEPPHTRMPPVLIHRRDVRDVVRRHHRPSRLPHIRHPFAHQLANDVIRIGRMQMVHQMECVAATHIDDVAGLQSRTYLSGGHTFGIHHLHPQSSEREPYAHEPDKHPIRLHRARRRYECHADATQRAELTSQHRHEPCARRGQNQRGTAYVRVHIHMASPRCRSSATLEPNIRHRHVFL
ncbi:Hypothetical cytosolic protein [Bifidobacterium animalis subsp. lactis CNCM I-2494]|uniref:Hypothetical cytosolic protein n=1 Tax=Bifidobacterium animalis subsp. lactis CNCM I-2494 TaxID=1042403 RepID=A0A806FW02_BIFAN|nr:Hypothetical cytosolic protein [Bifidobacterium animalis subsp. lactis CNCM I-2494]